MTLFLLGLTPFVLGFLMNSWLIQNPDSVLPFKLIGFIFLAFWVTVGFISYKIEKTLLKSAVIAHLPALLMLSLIMYQEIIVGQYWSNIIGIAAQFFFLPLINISSSVVGIVLSFIPWDIHVWSTGLIASIIAFLLMLTSYCLGYYLKK